MYINNTSFMELITRYKQSNSQRDYNNIAKNFMLICNRLLTRPCFSSYSKDRQEEMASHAQMNMIKYLPNFKLGYIDNPFSFFTKIAYNAFVQKINQNKKYDKIYKSIGYIEMMENNDR
jgi:hypothetical protein